MQFSFFASYSAEVGK